MKCPRCGSEMIPEEPEPLVIPSFNPQPTPVLILTVFKCPCCDYRKFLIEEVKHEGNK